MKARIRQRLRNLKNFGIIIPIVVTVIVSYFLMIRNEIIVLSNERLDYIGKEYTDRIAGWVDSVLEEFEVYRGIAEKENSMNEHVREILATSCGRHPEYPYGIYWGDKYGNYFDSSGWVPSEDYIIPSCVWYTEGLNHTRFEIGEPYNDRMTGEYCVSASVRLFFDNVESVMSVDVYLNSISARLEELTEQEIDYAFLVTRKSRIIVADSETSMVGQKLSETDSQLNRSISELIEKHFLGQTVIMADEAWCVNITRIENTDWLLVLCMKQSKMTEKLRQAEFIMVFLGLIVCVALILLAVLVARRISIADRKARTDPLTKLLNRGGLKEACTQALEHSPDHGVLLLMDMDNFKRINDELGHPVGDEVLISFAEMLKEYFNRNSDLSARIGGDEFAVFSGRNIPRERIPVMLDKFISMFHQNYDEKYSRQKLSVSIGIAFAEDCSNDFGELYRRADEALYTAKQNGKDCYSDGTKQE